MHAELPAVCSAHAASRLIARGAFLSHLTPAASTTQYLRILATVRKGYQTLAVFAGYAPATCICPRASLEPRRDPMRGKRPFRSLRIAFASKTAAVAQATLKIIASSGTQTVSDEHFL
jgi:hypothetical protein